MLGERSAPPLSYTLIWVITKGKELAQRSLIFLPGLLLVGHSLVSWRRMLRVLPSEFKVNTIYY